MHLPNISDNDCLNVAPGGVAPERFRSTPGRVSLEENMQATTNTKAVMSTQPPRITSMIAVVMDYSQVRKRLN